MIVGPLQMMHLKWRPARDSLHLCSDGSVRNGIGSMRRLGKGRLQGWKQGCALQARRLGRGTKFGTRADLLFSATNYFRVDLVAPSHPVP